MPVAEYRHLLFPSGPPVDQSAFLGEEKGVGGSGEIRTHGGLHLASFQGVFEQISKTLHRKIP